jgi:hypothetical protein
VFLSNLREFFNLKGVQFPAACCVKIIRFDVGFDTPVLAAG